jgi:hypothetical protein
VAVRELRLEVREFRDLTRWRWVLTRPGGALVADHEVRLDRQCWQYEAFTDLLGYLGWHSAPDQRARDEARIVGQVGAWIGSEVLGPVADALARERPTTVRVIVPDEAKALLYRPLELAHAAGTPLALRDVTLVMQPVGDDGATGMSDGPAGIADATAGGGGSADGASAVPAGGRLRVLGLFSLPEGGQPLNLRRERYELVQLVQGIAAGGRSADVRVLQYGVTRRRLREVLEDAEGWDVIHISGHGGPGELLLEKSDGTRDPVSSQELADLLDLARERVKLVTVSACWSAALTIDQQRQLLGLPLPEAGPGDRADGGRDRREPAPAGFESGALATDLAARLGCAVLAMRYPVGDEFAIALSAELYRLLADRGQPLPRAVGLALRHVLDSADESATGGGQGGATLVGRWPALSAGTPALFGGRAVDLRLAAPARAGPEDYSTVPLKLAGFPRQPERFVGRTGVMARASAALAAGSGVPGVVLHGMPGGGKTACALELAYTHEESFDRLVWFKAPDEGLDVSGALTDLALTLERELPGFRMVHVLADDEKLKAFMPALTELMERRRVLVVIDNAESLLTAGGQWRDGRWGTVTAALCAHRGLGRLVLTTRRLPAGARAVPAAGDGGSALAGLLVQAVDSLSLDEALLLIRELPHLRALVGGELAGVGREEARQLALGVLNVAQGHPKLLELADGQAADPGRLAALIAAGGQAWRDAGGLPDGFFAGGQTRASGEDYRGVLAAWTEVVSEGLGAGARDLFWFVCCLEEPDRERHILEGNWAGLRARLGRAGQPPDLDAALAAVAVRGLIAVQGEPAAGRESYAVHPGVAAAGRAQAGEAFRAAVDAEAAAYWDAVHRFASGETSDGGPNTRLLVRAGLAAVPYLIRRQQWPAAAFLLERAFNADPSRANAAAALPAIEEIAARDPAAAGVLARVLTVLDPAAGERQMRASLDAAVAASDYRSASVIAGRLADLCRASGRLAEALTLAEDMIGYTRQAGLGPWTQLADEGRRLQVLADMGQAELVLAEVRRLRVRMRDLPAASGPDETAIPWNVREGLLDTGRYAARQLGRWQDALDLNAELIASLRGRSAPAAGIALSRFNDYSPLLRLGRIDDALALLLDCRRVFHDARDPGMLGKTISALADVENARGHGDAAIALERDALRYTYLAGDVLAIAVSYHNLGNYLRRHARQPAPALACHLAAAVIRALTGAEGADRSLAAALTDLRSLLAEDVDGSTPATVPVLGKLGSAAALPADLRGLCAHVGDIPGADLAALLAALAPEATGEQVYAQLAAAVREAADQQDKDDAPAAD